MHRTIWLLACGLAFVGCVRSRTVLVKPGDPVQLRETVKGVKVWAFASDGTRVASETDLPEGAYVVIDDGAK